MRNFEKENQVRMVLSWYCKIVSTVDQDLRENTERAQLLGRLIHEENDNHCSLHRYSYDCGIIGAPAPELKKETEFELVGRGKLSPTFWETHTNECAQGYAADWSDRVKHGLLDDLQKKRITPEKLLDIHDYVINLSKKYIPNFSSDKQVNPVLSISSVSSNAYQFFSRNWLPITATTITGITAATAAIMHYRRNSQ